MTTLITGASSGIGREFAHALAARGEDLVLVARRSDRLEALADSLPTKATPIAMDLSGHDAGPRLDEALGDVRVTSLINCAGFGTTGAFHELAADRLAAEIDLNVAGLVSLNHTFIDRLRAHGRGVLVNVGSTAGYLASPRMAVYGATKAFVLSFTEALWYESRGTGLRVMVVSPGATDTEFFDVAGDEGHTVARMAPDRVVRETLARLDRRNPPPSMVPGLRNRLSIGSLRLISRRRVAMAIGGLMTPSQPGLG
jgi:uncharacterized protein